MTLSKITTPRKRRNFMVYDLEWYPGTMEVRLVGVYDGDRYRTYETVDDFLENELTRDNHDKWIYAHYGGMADCTFLLRSLIKRGGSFTVEASFSGASAIIIHIKHGRQVWHLVDSFWLLRDNLKNIGAAIGRKKTAEDYICPDYPDCGHVDAVNKKPLCVFYRPIGELRDYNEQDCLILYEAIQRFEDFIWGLGGQLQMTIASNAMHLWRRVYLTDDIETRADVNEWARMAYTSSRVEPFQTECDSAMGFDINSSFPFAMTSPCPGAMKRMHKGLPKGKDAIYIADVEVSIPDMYLPPLPYRSKGRVFFPTGTWRSWFSNIDLELLEQRGGRILKVYQSIEFEPQTDLRDYALDIYARRKAASDEFDRLTLKLLMNSLYGKFSEKTTKTGMLINPASSDCPHKVKHRCETFPNCVHAIEGRECNACMEMLMPGIFLVEDQVELEHEHVPIGVHITAIARRNLEGHLHAAYQQTLHATDAEKRALIEEQNAYIERSYGKKIRAEQDEAKRARLESDKVAMINVCGTILAAKRKGIFYTDSVAENRTVVLKSPEGRVVIRAVGSLWSLLSGGGVIEDRGKEFASPIGWTALGMDPCGKEGWFPLKRVIRHKVCKPMWRVSNKDGQTEVTSDHGIMLSASKSATPEEFVKAGANFVKVRAQPSSRVGETIDLWEFVKDFRAPGRTAGRYSKPDVRRFECDGEFLKLVGVVQAGESQPTRFRRFYEPGTPDFKALLRVIAAYVSEGSSSIRGVTTSRDMFSICQKGKRWLRSVARDLRVAVPTGYFSIVPVDRNGMWAIRAGSAPFACFFAALAGFKSAGMRLPAFMYDLSLEDMEVFWQQIMEGDGRWAETGEMDYTSTSPELTAGLSYMLDQFGIEHRISHRSEKDSWTIGTRPAGSGRDRKLTKVDVREPSGEEWVYDLSVEGANTFVDGIGRVLVHNTDSAMTTAILRSSDELGDLKIEYAIKNGVFVACKVYGVEMSNDKWKVKAKGFSNMDFNKFLRAKEGEEIEVRRMSRIREMYRKGTIDPVERIFGKRMVQSVQPKRCMLADGNSRAWTREEIDSFVAKPKKAVEPQEELRLTGTE